jgi:hypothetical protein
MISTGDVRGLTVPAKIGRKYVPPQTQRRDHWQKYLPPAAKSMQQY